MSAMCNHYQNHPEAIQTWAEYVGWAHDHGPFSETGRDLDVWPRRAAAVVRHSVNAGGAFAEAMTWGVPLTLPGKRPGTRVTKHVTNVRNLDSPFWRNMLLRPEQRCLVPFTRFAEPKAGGGRAEHWFTVLDSPVAAFAGVWRYVEPTTTVSAEPVEPKATPITVSAEPVEVPNDHATHPSTGSGLTEAESGPAAQQKVFAFLTCAPNPLVAPLHPKAMPVILHPEDFQTWLRAEWEEARKLVQPFPSQLMAVG